MSRTRLRVVPVAILLGLVWFMAIMGMSIALVMLNARVSPGVPWFPVPVLALVIGSSVLAERRWRIGLSHPPGVAWGRIYFLAFTTTVLGVCVAILQGAWFDMTREAELGPSGVSAPFSLAYAFVMSLVAAILAEVAFRGIMQGRLHAVLSPVAAIVLTAAVNTAAHRWSPDLAAQWFAYFVTLAGWGYVRWLGGSVLPPLAAHFWQNFALAAALYFLGPFDQGALDGTTLLLIAALAATALAATLIVGSRTRPFGGAQHGPAKGLDRPLAARNTQ